MNRWIGLEWNGMDWIGWDWIGLDWIGLDWIGLDWMRKNQERQTISCFRVFAIAIENFGGNPLHCAHVEGHAATITHPRDTKVCDGNLIVDPNQHVAWLQIPVQDANAVKIFHSFGNVACDHKFAAHREV